MEKHTCKTYFSVGFDGNAEELERFIVDNLGVTPGRDGRYFIIGGNSRYSPDVNKMLAVTLKDLFGKEDKIKEMQEKFSVTCALEIVPYIASSSEKPPQNLSLNAEIIDFLYNSGTAMDLDYYVI